MRTGSLGALDKVVENKKGSKKETPKTSKAERAKKELNNKKPKDAEKKNLKSSRRRRSRIRRRRNPSRTAPFELGVERQEQEKQQEGCQVR